MDPARRTSLPSTVRSPVVVDVPAVAAGSAAVGWAAREAARRGVDLRVIMPDDRGPLPLRRRAFARVVAQVRDVAPRVAVSASRRPDTRPRAERIASADAAVLVVEGPSPDAEELIMSAYCPVVVVPDGRAPVPAPRDPVLLAAGPATGTETIDFAFRAAADRHTGLLAVRTWYDPYAGLGRIAPGSQARRDEADERVHRDLAEQLSAFVVAHPTVRVQSRVVNDRCADLLAAFARRSRLLVLGRPSRGTVLGRARPSPALTLARLLPCPVAVVPPPGPPRHSWLPTRPVGWADLSR